MGLAGQSNILAGEPRLAQKSCLKKVQWSLIKENTGHWDLWSPQVSAHMLACTHTSTHAHTHTYVLTLSHVHMHRQTYSGLAIIAMLCKFYSTPKNLASAILNTQLGKCALSIIGEEGKGLTKRERTVAHHSLRTSNASCRLYSWRQPTLKRLQNNLGSSRLKSLRGESLPILTHRQLERKTCDPWSG